MRDSDWQFLMRNSDFVHGYAMAMVHSGEQLREILKRGADHFSKNGASLIEGAIEGSRSWEDWESRVYPEDSSIDMRNKDHTRGAYVYLTVSEPSMWRIRLEKYGDNVYGWSGGRVLWGHDQDNVADAVKIAKNWVENGVMPKIDMGAYRD